MVGLWREEKQCFIRGIIMRSPLFLPGHSSPLALTLGAVGTAPPDSLGTSTIEARSWTADNGDGTCSKRLFSEEFEDPDPIRVDNDHYLAGTTMYKYRVNHHHLAAKPDRANQAFCRRPGFRPLARSVFPMESG